MTDGSCQSRVLITAQLKFRMTYLVISYETTIFVWCIQLDDEPNLYRMIHLRIFYFPLRILSNPYDFSGLKRVKFLSHFEA